MNQQIETNAEEAEGDGDLDISTAFDGKDLKAFSVDFSEMENQIVKLVNNNDNRRKRLITAGVLN